MSLCNNLHVPQNSSIVILEYSHNDEHRPFVLWNNSARKPLERLVRKLLDYPLKPAVLFLHTYDWHEMPDPKGLYWENAERDMAELGTYYRLPAVSVKVWASLNIIVTRGKRWFLFLNVQGNAF